MSQNNNSNETAAAGMIIAVVGTVAMMFFIFIYLFFAFIAVAATILCLFAWNSPLKLGKAVIAPDEARRFIYGGLIGSVLLAAFCIFAAITFNIRIEDAWVPHILLIGYTLGSVGLQYLEAQSGAAEPHQTVIPPSQQIAPPPASQPPAKAFRFASWNDEDGR